MWLAQCPLAPAHEAGTYVIEDGFVYYIWIEDEALYFMTVYVLPNYLTVNSEYVSCSGKYKPR